MFINGDGKIDFRSDNGQVSHDSPPVKVSKEPKANKEKELTECDMRGFNLYASYYIDNYPAFLFTGSSSMGTTDLEFALENWRFGDIDIYLDICKI